jgi:hypothetical protein
VRDPDSFAVARRNTDCLVAHSENRCRGGREVDRLPTRKIIFDSASIYVQTLTEYLAQHSRLGIAAPDSARDLLRSLPACIKLPVCRFKQRSIIYVYVSAIV